MGLTDLIPLESGRVVIGLRRGVYYARVWLPDLKKYKEQSLKTSDRDQAIGLGRKFLWSIDEKRKSGLPLNFKSAQTVIDAYVAMRELEHRRGATSQHMLRHIVHIAQFWKEYLVRRGIAEVGDRELKGYVDWRRNYYVNNPEKKKPNVKLYPADKTIQFEMMVGKAILHWASEKGFRQNTPLAFSFSAKNRRVRPAFSEPDFRRLIDALTSDQWKIKVGMGRQQTIRRELLLLYVEFLANSGMRIGEANNLRLRDIEKFEDEKGRMNLRLNVRGKTGEREVIFRVAGYKKVANALLARRLREDDRNALFFKMPSGSKIITLIDQFKAVLKKANIERDSHGRPYTLYSLRHYYAVQALKRGVPIFTVALNMGTSVKIIQDYYGSHATPRDMATQLGD